MSEFVKNKKAKKKEFSSHSFFPKNRKAAIEEFVGTILWVVLFIVLVGGAYFLLKTLTGG